MFKSLISSFILFLFICQQMAAQTCPDIIGYYPNWQWYDRGQLVKPSTIQYSKYTIINYAFFKPELDGSISSADAWADENLLLGQKNWSTNPVSYYPNTSLIDLAHNASVKVLPSIGGWTLSDNFPSIAASALKRGVFAHHCCNLIRTYQFDGIDIDWEYPGYTPHNGSSADKQNFTLFLQQIRDSLTALGIQNNKSYMLTFAAGASRQNMANVEWNNVKNIVDIINLMSYDFFGSWDPVANHNSPLHKPLQGDATFNIDSAVTYLINHYQVPTNKLAAGVAFYGRSAKTSGTPALFAPINGADNITFSDDDGTPMYYNILKKMNLYNRQWDNNAKVPYLLGNGTLQSFVSYDDEESIGLKANYIKNKNLRGAIIWEITGDYIETTPGSGIIAGTPLVDTLKSVFCNGLNPVTTCNAPTNLNANPSTNSLNISWNSTNANSYLVEYKLSAASTWTAVSSSSNSINISGLQCNSNYSIRVQSICAANSSNFGSILNTSTTTCNTSCAIPSNINGTTTANSINLTWSSTNATSYSIQYKKSTDANWTTTNSSTNSASLNGLLSNTTYQVQIQSHCTSNVSAYSSIQTFTTQAIPISVTCSYASWNSSTIYNANDTVAYNGVIYRAKYWSQNEIPSANYGNCCVWDLIQPCAGYDISTCYKAPYDPLIAYTSGKQVYLDGTIYQAQWWTLNNPPAINSGPGMVWQVIAPSPCHSKLNVQCFIQGYFTGAAMIQSDSITITLFEWLNNNLFEKESFQGTLQSNGMISAYFPSTIIGKSCYIRIRHKNTIETWSANPITITQNTTYNFSTAANKAYGANQQEVGSGVFAIYSGDIDQNGYLELDDYNLWDVEYQAGYPHNNYAPDLDGNGYVELDDYNIWDLNYQNGVYSMAP